MKLYPKAKTLLFFIFCFLFMIILFFYFTFCETSAPVTGNCFENLSFQIESNQKLESIHCFYNDCENEGIYYLFFPSYADLSCVSVRFSIAERIKLESSDDQLLITLNNQTYELKPNCLYNIYFLSSDDQILESGKLMVLQSQNLPTMYIETQTGSLDNLRASKENAESGQLTMYSANGALEYCDTLDQITGRGNETWQYDKCSYGIKLHDETDLEGMGRAKNWVLLPNVTDDTYIRNKLTYDMAIAAGMNASPDSCFVDLYINKVYYGLYQLCEKIEIHPERLAIADLDLANKQLNSAQYTKGEVNQILTDNKKYIDLSWDPADISGGYVLERDYENKYAEEFSGFQTSVLNDFYSIKSPKYASEQEVTYICNLFNQMEKAVNSPDGINPDTQKAYSEYIDVDSFAFKYLIEEISRNNGGGASSAFYYKPENSISEKLYAGPVWDYDKAYGELRTLPDTNTRDLAYLTLNRTSTDLYWLLYQFPDFRQTVREKYQAFFSDYLNYLVEEKIDQYFAEIQASAKMDRLRWKGFNVRFDEEYDSLNENITFLKKFIADRKAYLDEVWADDAVPICTVHFIYSDIGYETIEMRLGVLKGERLQICPSTAQDSNGNIFKGWFYENTQKEFDPAAPILDNVTVIAHFS